MGLDHQTHEDEIQYHGRENVDHYLDARETFLAQRIILSGNVTINDRSRPFYKFNPRTNKCTIADKAILKSITEELAQGHGATIIDIRIPDYTAYAVAWNAKKMNTDVIEYWGESLKHLKHTLMEAGYNIQNSELKVVPPEDLDTTNPSFFQMTMVITPITAYLPD